MTALSPKRASVMIHFLVVGGLLAIFCLPFAWPFPLPPVYWMRQAFFYVIYVGLFYLNFYVFVPRLLLCNMVAGFICLACSILMLIVLLNHVVDDALNIHKIVMSGYARNNDRRILLGKILADLGSIVTLCFVLGLSTVLRVTQKFQSDRLERQELDKEKISSELAFLKTQINPHFYFNVQHSIYALMTSNIEMAREAVYTLSQMMRYVLYDTRYDLTSLLKEINFIESYIKLMKLRLGDNVQIILDKGSLLQDVNVAPMLFLPFVENAFKHGISAVYPSYIYIGITTADNNLMIEVRNSVFAETHTLKEEYNGIGLLNTRRRLDLIYPGRYRLITKNDRSLNEFSIQLTVTLI